MTACFDFSRSDALLQRISDAAVFLAICQLSDERPGIVPGDGTVLAAIAPAMAESLSSFERSRVREGRSVVIGGRLFRPGSGSMAALQAALRTVERGAAPLPCSVDGCAPARVGGASIVRDAAGQGGS